MATYYKYPHALGSPTLQQSRCERTNANIPGILKALCPTVPRLSLSESLDYPTQNSALSCSLPGHLPNLQDGATTSHRHRTSGRSEQKPLASPVQAPCHPSGVCKLPNMSLLRSTGAFPCESPARFACDSPARFVI
eukprot:13451218-Alexandrium_andersonii.AAC.1